MSLVVVDYGMGNVRSVAKALEFVGARHVVISDDPATLEAADRIVLPGVGALRACMDGLRGRGLLDVLRRGMEDRPFLGICLGMQALLETSEEGDGTQGLGLIDGEVRHLGPVVAGKGLKVPHMGWNRVRQTREHPLWSGIDDRSWFYFVHSYHVVPEDPDVCAGETDYGTPFCSALARDRLFAVQFHPEKSQQAGLRLLENFVAWNGAT